MGWRVAHCECRICGEKHVSVFPEDILDEDRQECPGCGHMTAEVVEDVE